MQRKLNIYEAKDVQTTIEKKNSDNIRQTYRTNLSAISSVYDQKKQMVDEDRKDIEQKTRERDLLNKDVATAEEKEREQVSTITTLENELKKLQNKIQGYKAEA